MTGLVVLIVANIIWLLAASNVAIIIAIIFTGMHLGITQGVLRTLIAMSTTNIRGTAFALFYLVSGCGVFIGNAIAGLLAEKFSLSAIFIGGMLASCVALIIVLALRLYRNKEYDLQMIK
jgi:MFS family permease